MAIIDECERIDDQNDVKRPWKRTDEPGILGIADLEAQMRIRFARLRNHPLTEVYTKAEGRLECGQEMPGSAAELQHP